MSKLLEIEYFELDFDLIDLNLEFEAKQPEQIEHLINISRNPLEKPPFLVTDNGSSFLSHRFGAYLKDRFSHVRIRYRTPTQLGLLERFHRTLKEEEVYWHVYQDVAEARRCLAEFRERYNQQRPHWALIPESGGDPWTPAEVYQGDRKTGIPKWQAWAQHAKDTLETLLDEVD